MFSVLKSFISYIFWDPDLCSVASFSLSSLVLSRIRVRNVPEGCTEQPNSVWLGREALPAPLRAELQGLREGRKPLGVYVSGR